MEKRPERFFVRFNDGGYDKFWELVDRETGEVVGSDGGEPEDALLVRDFGWVVDLANRLASENVTTGDANGQDESEG